MKKRKDAALEATQSEEWKCRKEVHTEAGAWVKARCIKKMRRAVQLTLAVVTHTSLAVQKVKYAVAVGEKEADVVVAVVIVALVEC